MNAVLTLFIGFVVGVALLVIVWTSICAGNFSTRKTRRRIRLAYELSGGGAACAFWGLMTGNSNHFQYGIVAVLVGAAWLQWQRRRRIAGLITWRKFRGVWPERQHELPAVIRSKRRPPLVQ